MRQIWMWTTDDERDGWWGDHATKEAAVVEAKEAGAGGEYILVAPGDADEVAEGKEVPFLGPKEKIELENADA